jgi:hypothetical protein
MWKIFLCQLFCLNQGSNLGPSSEDQDHFLYLAKTRHPSFGAAQKTYVCSHHEQLKFDCDGYEPDALQAID